MSILFSGWFFGIAIAFLLVGWNYGKDFLKKRFIEAFQEIDENGIKTLSDEPKLLGEFKSEEPVRDKGCYKFIFHSGVKKKIIFCPFTIFRLISDWKFKRIAKVLFILDAYTTSRPLEKPIKITLNYSRSWKAYLVFTFFFNWGIGMLIGPFIVMFTLGTIYNTQPIIGLSALLISWGISIVNSGLQKAEIIVPKKETEILTEETWLLPIESDTLYVDVYLVEYDIELKVTTEDKKEKIMNQHIGPIEIKGYDKVQDLKIDPRIKNITFHFWVEYDRYSRSAEYIEVPPRAVPAEEFQELSKNELITNLKSHYLVEYDEKIIKRNKKGEITEKEIKHVGPLRITYSELKELKQYNNILNLDVYYTVKYDRKQQTKEEIQVVQIGPEAINSARYSELCSNPDISNLRLLNVIEYNEHQLNKQHVGPITLSESELQELRKQPDVRNLEYTIKKTKKINVDLTEMKSNRRSYLARNAALWEQIITLSDHLLRANKKIRTLHAQLSYQQATEHERISDALMTAYKQAEEEMINLKNMFTRIRGDAVIGRDWKKTVESCMRDFELSRFKELMGKLEKLMNLFSELAKTTAEKQEKTLMAEEFEKFMTSRIENGGAASSEQ